MRKKAMIFGGAALVAGVLATVALAAAGFNHVKPSTYDPGKTNLVNASWQTGLGCPTNARTFNGTSLLGYTDSACTTGDSMDKKNAGLLLAKTGPTGNWAAAQAILKKVPGTITELGYDIRKAGVDQNDTRGSHCGNGAPRFDLVDDTGATYFVGCNSPAPVVSAASDAWLRLRWSPVMAYPAAGGGPVPIASLTIEQIAVVFDEGQDTGPDNFGLAVLDNIDVNGVLVGK